METKWSSRVSESQTVVDMSLSADAKRLAIASSQRNLGRARQAEDRSSVKGVSTVDVERRKHSGGTGSSAKEQK